MLGVLASITINIDPIIFQLGPLSPRWYGLMYVVGIIVGVWVVQSYANRLGINGDQIQTVLGPAIVAGLIGGRLYYVVQQPLEPFLRDPIRIIAVWEGGMAFYGAIFAVALTLVIVCRLNKIPLWPMIDTAAIFAVVGQFFGRIGNVINGDIVGPPTDLPWGFVYTHPGSFVPDHTVAYHPAGIYEMFFNVILFLIIWNLRWRVQKTGMIFALYLIGYSLGQFLLFFIRTEPILFLGLKQAQQTAVVVFVAGLLLLWWRWRKGSSINVARVKE